MVAVSNSAGGVKTLVTIVTAFDFIYVCLRTINCLGTVGAKNTDT